MKFAYTNSTLVALRRTITDDRLANYLVDAKGDLARAVELYVANMRLCETLYGPLQGLEVSVRNAVNAELIARYGGDWAEHRRAPLLPFHVATIDEAIRTLRVEGKAVSNANLMGELTFGFWVGLFGPKYETNLWRMVTRKAFPHRPRRVERREVLGALNALRRLRNRVAHHERILHRNLVADHDLILEVVGWICPETAAWIAAYSSFDPGLIP